MSLWAYEARDSAGKVVRGTHDAADRRSALEFLRQQGLFLTKLEVTRGTSAPTPVKAPVTAPTPAKMPEASSHRFTSEGGPQVAAPQRVVGVPPLAPRPISSSAIPGSAHPGTAAPPIAQQSLLRASSKDLSQFFRQIAAMLHAGTSIGAALHSMASHAPNAALRKASAQMEARAMAGEPVSESMRAFPGLFTPLQIGMVSAGERGGFMEAMYSRLAKYAERDYDLQQTIKRETWYPKLLVFASIFIPGAVPLVLAIVRGGQNPFLAWLGSVGPPLLILGLAVLIYRAANYASPLAAHQQGPKLWLDSIKLRIPVAGKVVRGLATAKFCRALGALYGAGVGVSESVRLAADACGNAAIARDSIGVIPRLEHGERLTDCLASTGQFPSSVIQVMHVGEETGSLDTQLDKSADFLENDAEVAVKQSVQVLGVIVFVLIAIRIGFQVAQFYLGYFNSIFDEAERASFL
jgi:type IV pilus assembly protein PilC